jgi:hypothetical protein
MPVCIRIAIEQVLTTLREWATCLDSRPLKDAENEFVLSAFIRVHLRLNCFFCTLLI